jgi:DNA-binding NtrC family response regulator
MNLALKSRILVVDDDPAKRDLVATHLTHHGYVATCASAAEALAVPNESIDVVVTLLPPPFGSEALLAAIERANDPLCSLAELERRHVARVLESVGGNKAAAARILGIERKTLYRMLDRWSALEGACALEAPP